ncbi:MAG: TIGR02530 family flagellar biosynthesis protein [Bacillota bacterium]
MMVGKVTENQALATVPRPAAPRGKAGEFQALLQRELAGSLKLKLSAHAEKRLRERNITLTANDLLQLGKAVESAATKGTREVLLLYGDLSLIASTANRTVVTAVTREEGRIFTNIDGAVIVK